MDAKARQGQSAKSTSSLSSKPLFLRLYLQSLQQNPVLTKAITSGALAGLSDIISQFIVGEGKSGDWHYSWRSTAAFAIFSTVVTAPVTHYLYQFLEGVVPKRSKFSSVKKAVLDRLLFAPPYLLALFYSVAIMEGKSHSEAWRTVKSVFWGALVRNVIIWGLAQCVNMSYVPVKYRVLFGNVVAFIWNIYLALLRR